MLGWLRGSDVVGASSYCVRGNMVTIVLFWLYDFLIGAVKPRKTATQD